MRPRAVSIAPVGFPSEEKLYMLADLTSNPVDTTADDCAPPTKNLIELPDNVPNCPAESITNDIVPPPLAGPVNWKLL